jgi:hypothetical protein
LNFAEASIEPQGEKMEKSKQELLVEVKRERDLLEDVLKRINKSQMGMPGAVGIWSVKDTLAHISAWERWMIDWISSLLADKRPETPEPWDVERMNSEILARVKDLPINTVLEEFHNSYSDSMELVQRFTDKQLNSVYADRWPMGVLWEGISANMNWHYREHRMNFETWLEKEHKEEEHGG